MCFSTPISCIGLTPIVQSEVIAFERKLIFEQNKLL